MTAHASSPSTEQIRESWERLAAGFDEFTTPLTMSLANDVLSRVDLGPGMLVLDVAAGSGALSIPAARTGARVVAVDIAPTMIERLDVRAHQEGLANLEGRVMDGADLDLEDDTFDLAMSMNGVSLFPDLPGGLRELVRVTKPGGRVLIAAFGPPPKAEFIGFLLGALQAAIPGFTGLPMDPPPLPFRLADPERMNRGLVDAGLTDVRVEIVTGTMAFQSATHLWDTVTNSNPIGSMLVADLTQEQATEVQQVLDRMLRERSGGGPAAVLNIEINVGIGTKP